MIKKIIMLSAAVIMLAACTKEGPQGPRGYNGRDGRDGINAAAPQLFYFNIPVKDFKLQSKYESPSELYNKAWLAFGEINGVQISEKDLVMVFMHQTTDGGPDNYFQALPYTDYFDNSQDFNHYSYGVLDTNGNLVFSIRRNDGTAPFNNMNETWEIQYNVYLIKGSATRKASLPQDINLNNEAAFRAYYNIDKQTSLNQYKK